MNNTLLTMQDICLTYHTKQGETKALDKVNFMVNEGEFVSIVGPSGCGKTTILSLISGLLKPSSGKILVNGNEVNGRNELTGYMFQKDNLFEWRTIRQNVILGLEITKTKTAENLKYVEDL